MASHLPFLSGLDLLMIDDIHDRGEGKIVTSGTMVKPVSCCGEQLPVRPALTLTDKFKSLRAARKQWSEAGYKLVTVKEWRARYKVCKGCDSFVDGQCQECGCFMFIKALLAGMTCKRNLW